MYAMESGHGDFTSLKRPVNTTSVYKKVGKLNFTKFSFQLIYGWGKVQEITRIINETV